ncbi:MAG: 2-oxo acid dehydrogenase subunit E2, partial [Pseudolabrys sp.]|nr:2-oxo acid dehydrogenase subunit E2 [Pseudolabrys sp.]
IDRDGNVNVRIIYDHRVLDGATVARALARLEEILNTEIVSELRSLSQDR